MFEAIKEALEKANHLYLFTGDFDPFFVLNKAGVERRKRLYLQSGEEVKITKLSKGDIGDSFEKLLELDGEVLNAKEEVAAPKKTAAKRTRKKTDK